MGGGARHGPPAGGTCEMQFQLHGSCNTASGQPLSSRAPTRDGLGTWNCDRANDFLNGYRVIALGGALR